MFIHCVVYVIFFSVYDYFFFFFFFFFQAEDGIRDGTVTGVQTCALPILSVTSSRPTTQKGCVGILSARNSTIGKMTTLNRHRLSPWTPQRRSSCSRDRKSVV